MPPLARILVAEDDQVQRSLIVEICRGEGAEVSAAEDGERAIAIAAGSPPFDLVLSDLRMGDGPTGMDVLAALQRRSPDTPVIILTAFGDVAGAMQAIQHGAYDYLSKPFDIEVLRGTVRRALERRRLVEENREQRKRGERKATFGDIVGKAPAMLEVYKMVARVAGSISTVLVVGESGTGKELVARAIHTNSPRAKHKFVAVNCSALTESLLESELFGHEKGSFTGATAQKRGLFEEAEGGTLFLDEIGDIGPKMQAQLLRVLQEGEIRRVGGNAAVPVDVRVVAATNRNLGEEVKAGRFRDDLFFRVNVVSIALPPLRDRREDIPLLVEYFLEKYARRPGHDPRADVGVAPAAMQALCSHVWPGNVRELENTLERALALSKDGFITPADLPREIAPPPPPPQTSFLVEDRPSLAELDRRYIEFLLGQTQGNKKRTAEILGIDRRTLYRMLERDARAESADEAAGADSHDPTDESAPGQ